jgi:hypothetical protein
LIEKNLPSEGKILFMSVASNFPSHEAAIHNYAQKGREITTLAGDIGRVITKETLTSLLDPPENNSRFHFFRWDAQKMQFKKEAVENTVNVLWDRRGVLWHQAEFYVEKHHLARK